MIRVECEKKKHYAILPSSKWFKPLEQRHSTRSNWKKHKKAPFISEWGLLDLMRRRPTLPHTFAYSTIGPAGLNFRVRDGNGWNPRGKITARLSRLGRGN